MFSFRRDSLDHPEKGIDGEGEGVRGGRGPGCLRGPDIIYVQPFDGNQLSSKGFFQFLFSRLIILGPS